MSFTSLGEASTALTNDEIQSATKALNSRIEAIETADVGKLIDDKVNVATEALKSELAKSVNQMPRITIKENYEYGLGQALHILGMSNIKRQSVEESYKELRAFRPVHPLIEKNLSTLTGLPSISKTG